MRNKKGFTLIEILVVIGIIAILAAVVLVALNPARQFAQARNSQRQSNVTTILDAIGQRIADNKGVFNGTLNGVTCPSLPTASSTIQSGGSGAVVDLSCLVPTYIASQLPVDPNGGTWTSSSSYNTAYQVYQDTASGRVTVIAPNTDPIDGMADISITR